MSENRKYYYMKLKREFFHGRQDGHSGKYAGRFALFQPAAEDVPHVAQIQWRSHAQRPLAPTPQTIATFTRHQIGTVERAIKVFLEFGLVEILTNGSYYMADIQLLIGQSSTEGERKRKERMRLKRQNLLPSGQADKCPPYISANICPPEIRDKSLECGSAHAYGRYQNVLLTSEELSELQTELPALWQTYVDRLSEHMASISKQYQSHAATIRRWAAEDRKKAAPQARNRDYSVWEGETV